MKKIIAVSLGLALCVLLLTGCSLGKKEEETTAVENDAAVVGVWTEDTFESGYKFNADGTGLDIFWDLPYTYTALDGIITITYNDDSYVVAKYAYSVSGSSISMTRQSDDGKTFSYNRTGDGDPVVSDLSEDTE